MCGEVEQSERVKEKIQEDVNKLKEQIALRKRKTAEEERGTYLFWILWTGNMAFNLTLKFEIQIDLSSKANKNVH